MAKKENGVVLVIFSIATFVLSISLLALFFYANRALKSKLESAIAKNVSVDNVSLTLGKVTLENLKVKDKKGRERGKIQTVVVRASIMDFLRGMHSISDIKLLNPYFLIEKDKESNPLSPIFSQVSDLGKKKEKMSPFHVKKAEIINGILEYVDNVAKEGPITFKLRNLNLELSDLSFPLDNRFTSFDFEAEILGINTHGKMSGSGKVNLVTKDAESNLKIRNLDAKTLEPYLRKMKHGIKIENGILDVDMKISVVSKKLIAPCNIVIRDLKMGHSSKITDEMIGTALKHLVSLLKDKKGEIGIETVIEGNLDDPQFSLGSAIAKGVLRGLAQKLFIF